MGTGSHIPICHTYLASIASKEYRGIVTSLCPLFVCFGILVSNVVCILLTWRKAAIVGAVLPLFVMATTCLMEETKAPTTPKKEERKMSLHDILVPESQSRSRALVESLKKYLFILKPMFLTTSVFLIQALSGAQTISYYTSTIFNAMIKDRESLKYLGILIIGSAYVLGYLLASCYFLRRFNRRTLLIGSAALMALSTGTVAVVGFLDLGSVVTAAVSFTALAIFALAYSCGFGPVPFIYLGEMFPPEHNGLATGTVTALNCTFTFLSLKAFPYMLQYLKIFGSFMVSLAACLLGIVFVMLVVPETKDLSTEEIGEIFGRKENKNVCKV